ncbi:MAG: SUMF1/EgtB/PvdO family nonheme iron enzyme [Rhodocyclaceae bacterium]
MSDIFICYSRKDQAVAAALSESFQAQGWTVFLDANDESGPGGSAETDGELAATRAVVALWSADSVANPGVLATAQKAAETGLLLPVRLGQAVIPAEFEQFATPALAAGIADAEGVGRLVVALDERLGAAAQAEAPAGPRYRDAGETFRDPLKGGGEGPLMIVIPAGSFMMGSPPEEPDRGPAEGPQHEVRFAEPFALGVCAVTFNDFDRFCEATQRPEVPDQRWGRGGRPVVNVTWDDAQAYCTWLTEQTGRTYRLPSEAEWEYACRAGTTTAFHTGDSLNRRLAKYTDGLWGPFSSGETEPVGSYPANGFGLRDMHGNVMEWCQDAWHANYEGAPTDGSAWEAGGKGARVMRGGAWNVPQKYARSANRQNTASGSRLKTVGFRVCCGAPTV